MASVNRTPPPGDDFAAGLIRGYRDARRIAVRAARIGEEEEKREEEELDEIDDAIVGSDRRELERLRSEIPPPDRDGEDRGS